MAKALSTPLEVAASRGNHELVQELLEGENPREDISAALVAAVQGGSGGPWDILYVSLILG